MNTTGLPLCTRELGALHGFKGEEPVEVQRDPASSNPAPPTAAPSRSLPFR